MKLRALRGAITVDRNDAEAIMSATEELVSEVIDRNGIATDDMV
ncbi:MAG: chorismate mutase, partial [Thermoleophilaceae bacterium]